MRNPFITHLHILQLEGYKPRRFLRWWIKHPLTFKLENKKALVWTGKTKFIYWLSGGLWPLMFLALLILRPYEIVNRGRVKNKTRAKVDHLKKTGLRVIGITGSYGKTSTKEFLYQILKTKYQVLRTPESYNTVFGVARVVDWELDDSYDFFICEMGAYKRGEILELCAMTDPDSAILTGINEQHLERFGSIQNTIKAKFELVDYVLKKGGKVLINNGNKLASQNKRGTEIEYGRGKYQHPSEQNIDGAAKTAELLGMTKAEIKKAITQIKLPPHRLTLVKRGEMTIIDDAYSSNTDGFRAAVEYLKRFSGWKVIITPGVAELGHQTTEIHERLGKLLKGIDQVILVGKNDRTLNLERGFGSSAIYVERVNDALAMVKQAKSTVLFENDLPDNY